jgi:L-threonylcarbamoyladenylate synthase
MRFWRVDNTGSMRRVFVDPRAPQRDAIHEAAHWILNGGLVAVPTDTLYGLAVDPFRTDAVTRLFAAKSRDEGHAVPLIAADAAQVREHLAPLSPRAACLVDRFWPGPLTVLVAAPFALARNVDGGTGKIGIRVPDHAVARAIAAACGRPITATSANVSGEPATADPDDVERTLGDRIDLLIDAGPTPGGPPSTIVDTTADDLRLVRAGAVHWDDIEACLRRSGLEHTKRSLRVT